MVNTLGAILLIFVVFQIILLYQRWRINSIINRIGKKPKNRSLKDLKKGDNILIEYWKMASGNGIVRVVNNDPQTKRY